MSTNLAFAGYRSSSRNTSSVATTSAPTPCECSRTYNLQVEQGATLASQISITLNALPVDITGAEFQFTAKLDATLPDTDPSVVKIDWHETATPTQGITWLTIPAATTQVMQPLGYQYQVRMVSSSGVVTPIVHGVLTITVPISSRF